jgi:DNA repair protein SbcD/Mre11
METPLKATFLHLADVHLGHEQYGLPQRSRDFASAFHAAVEYAIYYKVDFILIAGDLFERSTLDPVTFDQALQELEILRSAGIPVVNIAGNHDRARYGQGMAWVESLGRHGFLYYLDAARQGEIKLSPWSAEAGWGGYLDLNGIRFVGMRYLGASTPWAVEELAKQLQELSSGERPYTAALLHGGLDGVMPGFRAEMTYAQLAPLQGLVDYVALGHIHKYYMREGWVYNPGSLETWNASEVEWQRGFLHVAVDTTTDPRHVVHLQEPPRRDFRRYRIDVQPCTSPQQLVELVRRSLAEWAAREHSTSPVVHLTLFGRLRFDRRDLDLKAVEAEVEAVFNPLAVQVRDQTEDTAFVPEGGGDDEKLDRGALERSIFRQLFANDERRVHSASEWARLTQDLKRETLSRRSPEELANLIRQKAPLLAAQPDAGPERG